MSMNTKSVKTNPVIRFFSGMSSVTQILIGLILGILLAYGFVGPLASILGFKAADSTRVYQTIKVTLLASLNGYAPQVAVEFGRKVLTSTDRPSFKELEDHVKHKK